ncbi:MAG TPA: nucleoside-diphosphate sugar epimerase [Ureibacillus sp.]|nr:nucleoside-diphosphate sugar epimerase [Ureibacillus sp.]
MYLLRLSWLISLGISLLGFLIIGHFFTIQPDEFMSNGSLGFIGIIFVLPFLLLSIFTTFRFFFTFTRASTNQLMKFLSICGGFLLIAVLVYLTLKYKNENLSSIGEAIIEPNPTFFNLPMLNEYTYTIYFNFYTFALTHVIIAVIASFVGLLVPITKKEELPE